MTVDVSRLMAIAQVLFPGSLLIVEPVCYDETHPTNPGGDGYVARLVDGSFLDECSDDDAIAEVMEELTLECGEFSADPNATLRTLAESIEWRAERIHCELGVIFSASSGAPPASGAPSEATAPKPPVSPSEGSKAPKPTHSPTPATKPAGAALSVEQLAYEFVRYVGGATNLRGLTLLWVDFCSRARSDATSNQSFWQALDAVRMAVKSKATALGFTMNDVGAEIEIMRMEESREGIPIPDGFYFDKSSGKKP